MGDTDTDESDDECECECNVTVQPPEVTVNVQPPEVNVTVDPPVVNVSPPEVTVNTTCSGFVCEDKLPVLVCRIREVGPDLTTRGMTFRARSKKEWEWGFTLNDGSRWGIHATAIYDALIEPIRN